MKIVLTGGAGFIGSHLCARLLNEKHSVLCVDNFLTGTRENLKQFSKNKNFVLLEQDIIKPLPSSITADAVFHLASPASPNYHSKLSYHALPLETLLVNTQGTYELLKFSLKNKAKFLFASSSEVYGDPLEHPQKETYYGNVSTTGPRSIYDEAKRFGETLTSYFIRVRTLDGRIGRIFNTFGPRMLKDDMRMVIAFITQGLENKPLTIFGGGSQTRSLCYIDDMVEGLMRLMFYPQTKGQIINLGSSEEHTVIEYAKLIKKILQSKSEIVYSEKLPEDDPKKRKPDITKARKLLGWIPKVSLQDGLGKMIEYYKKQQ
ncbi:NAD-dependent epimerase/dehydratase family protein [Candidatus Roizmanbacteria bacterium]|nr:NAD-dependent epimerase/dehydratase family protein [Candidatus Roizmanbacteria bacterium]